MAHSWERPLHPWEAPGYGDPDYEPPEDPVSVAEQEFLDTLLHEYFAGTLSARAVCEVCYWAGKGGMGPRVQAYGKAPGSNSGHYQRHLDVQLGFKVGFSQQYSVPVVGQRRGGTGRTEFEMPVRNPHESLERELVEDTSIPAKLRDAMARNQLPPHPMPSIQ